MFQNLWQAMLRRCSRKSSEPESHLIVLGGAHDGKHSLFKQIAMKLENDEEANSIFGPAISYSYCDVMDLKKYHKEPIDFPAKVNTWIMANEKQSELLKLCIKAQNLKNTVLVLNVNLSKPYTALPVLEKWMCVVEKLVVEETCKLSVDEQDALKSRVHKLCQTALAENEIAEEGDTKNAAAAAAATSLGDGMLTTNLGIPIIVVGTQSDQLKLDDDHANYFQLSLRKFCQKYGAGLVFTSSTREINCGLLQHYLLRLMYPHLLKRPLPKPKLFEKAALFIPGGWDSNDHISLLRSDKASFSFDQTFSSVLKAPATTNKQKKGKERIKLAQDNQAFLAQLKKYKHRRRPKPRSGPVSAKGKPKNEAYKSLLQRMGKPKVRKSSSSSPKKDGKEGEINGEVLTKFFKELIKRPKAPKTKSSTRRSRSSSSSTGP